MKTCTKCQITKAPVEFYLEKASLDGRHPHCKECRRLYMRKRRELHPQLMTTEQKDRHREKAKARAHTPKRKKVLRKYRESFKGRYTYLLYCGKKRNKEVSITFEQYRGLVENKLCTYCSFQLEASGTGLDRVDIAVGYHFNNVVPCCAICNITRGIVWSYNEMKELGKLVRELRLARKGAAIKYDLNSYRKRG